MPIFVMKLESPIFSDQQMQINFDFFKGTNLRIVSYQVTGLTNPGTYFLQISDSLVSSPVNYATSLTPIPGGTWLPGSHYFPLMFDKIPIDTRDLSNALIVTDGDNQFTASQGFSVRLVDYAGKDASFATLTVVFLYDAVKRTHPEACEDNHRKNKEREEQVTRHCLPLPRQFYGQ